MLFSGNFSVGGAKYSNEVFPDDLALLTLWGDEDNVAQHILTSRLGTIPHGLLPSSNLVARTALLIYQTLVRYYC